MEGSTEVGSRRGEVLSSDLRFQPSDPDASARASIDAWAAQLGVSNILPAIALDS
jgi:hypothetical protein